MEHEAAPRVQKRVIIGFGSGRCGTKSLAGFLDKQKWVSCSHEDLVPFDPQWNKYFPALSLLLRQEESIVGNISAAWINYIDRLVDDIVDLRLICLDRGNPGEVVKSFHSYCKAAFEGKGKEVYDREKDRFLNLYDVYPVRAGSYSRNAVKRAVGAYLRKQSIALAEYKQILVIETGRMNERGIQEQILDHCGIPDEHRVYGMDVLNKRDEMGKRYKT